MSRYRDRHHVGGFETERLGDPRPGLLAAGVVGDRGFRDTAIPLEVVACDLDSGEEVGLTEGPLLPALLASAALPGAFPPVEHQGRRLIDGGVLNNVPVDRAGAAPRTRVYVLDVVTGLDQHPVSSALGVLLRAFSIARHSEIGITRMAVEAQGRSVAIGGFLNPDDRESFATAFSRALATAKTR